MQKIYDEKVCREIDVDDGVDICYMRVRLFKAEVREVSDGKLYADDLGPVYMLVKEYDSFTGPPGPDRRRRYYSRHTWLTGPDSLRIRQAIEALDQFGGKRASSSR